MGGLTLHTHCLLLFLPHTYSTYSVQMMFVCMRPGLIFSVMLLLTARCDFELKNFDTGPTIHFSGIWQVCDIVGH